MAKPKQPQFDPVATLRAIAADPEAGSTARVSACKVLLAYERDMADPEKSKDGTPTDAITRKALKILQGGKA